MTLGFLESFLQITGITLISLVVILFIYLIFGYFKPSYIEGELRRDPYSGGKASVIKGTFFKSSFFQFAIYFLIFDVVAFITALASFYGNWQLFLNGKINPDSFYVIIYLLLVLSIFIILPRSEEEII